MKRKLEISELIFKIISYTLLTVFALACLYPFIYAISAAISDRAAVEYGEANPEAQPVIQIAADTINDQFAVQIENPCLSVSYAPAYRRGSRAGGEAWLPADAFVSKHGGGYGLRRMDRIAAKYGGNAWFSFDAQSHVFVTRLMLPVSEV